MATFGEDVVVEEEEEEEEGEEEEEELELPVRQPPKAPRCCWCCDSDCGRWRSAVSESDAGEGEGAGGAEW